MFRALFSFLMISISVVALGQTAFSAKKIPAAQLPPSIKYAGKLREAWKWKDQSGENFLLITKTPVHAVKSTEWGEDARGAELYAWQYVKTDSGFTSVWKLTDLVKECAFDITLDIFPGGVLITDLDKDSIAEVTLVYKLSCRSDVSPDEMKLIMREGASKYALRGLTCDPGNPEKRTCVNADSLNLEIIPRKTDEWEQEMQAFGRYATEKEFTAAPAEFLAFARNQWFRFVNRF